MRQLKSEWSKFVVRLPEYILDYIREKAKNNASSMNSEIVRCIRLSMQFSRLNEAEDYADLKREGVPATGIPGELELATTTPADELAAHRPDWDPMTESARVAEAGQMLRYFVGHGPCAVPAHGAETLATLLLRDASYPNVQQREAVATALTCCGEAARLMSKAVAIIEEADLA